MGSSILGVGQSAMNAAQIGLATTGHNIANVNTPGYNRQVVMQAAAPGQNIGVGYVGKGTEVNTIKRVYNEFLAQQVRNTQTSKGAVDSYYAQMKQIDNILADPTSGVSSALQDFFKGVQDVSSNPSSPAARQAMLSAAESMESRFQSVSTRMGELSEGVNAQVSTTIIAINNYAQQLADLNDAIELAQGTAGEDKPANDLLDQRDQIVSDLSKEIKVTVVKQGNSYNVFMGSGQALTVGSQVFKLRPLASPTDPSKIQVAYEASGKTTLIPDTSLNGGRLGGLLEFRSNSLEPAQNALGRVAIGLAMTFNAQHRLGQDQLGDIGTNFFTPPTVQVNASGDNSATASVSASYTDVSKLTTSDYSLRRDGGNFTVTRLSDNKQVWGPSVTGYVAGAFPSSPVEIDGFSLTQVSAMADGDEFVIKPTINGASNFGVAITDPAKIAAGAPIRTQVGATNTGTGTISAGTVNTTPAGLKNPVTISFTSATAYNLTDSVTGVTVPGTIPAGGGNISYNGWTVQVNGAPASGDTFSVGPNSGGVGDNRNALLLGALQTANTLGNSANSAGTYQGASMSLQGAYTYMVSQVGNKTRELEVSGKAEEKLLASAIEAQQSESGVNLDEEAANLMRYQQAYQAAAKIMQTASDLFNLLLDLGQ